MKTRVLFILMLLACLGNSLNAQTEFTKQTLSKAIWDGTDNTDYDAKNAVLYGYLPQNSNGRAIIICPGGGYTGLCMDYEGTDFAPWLNENGIACFVLKYRLPAGRYNVPLADAKQAIQLVRENAVKWGIDPNAIGIMGSSAGGHLAATASTQYTTDEAQPNFQVLLYPVITMDASYTHAGSRQALLGDSPTTYYVNKFSNEKQVKATTPQAFVVVSAADELVPVKNSLQYTQALINKSIPVSLHVYPGGFHGFGHKSDFKDYAIWHEELMNWLMKEVTATVPDPSESGDEQESDDSGYKADTSKALLTSTSQLSDNCYWVYTGVDMSVNTLLDGSKLTHFHSDATNTTSLSQLNQYIQMDLQEPQSAIQLYFAGRALGQVPGTSIVTTMTMVNTPNHIIISATNTPSDASSWTKIQEITEGFPGLVDGGEFYSKPIVFDTPMRYIRMIVKGAEQTDLYWNISELQVYPCVATAVSNAKAETKSEGIYSLDGRQVRNDGNTAGLNSGIYVIGNKKVSIK